MQFFCSVCEENALIAKGTLVLSEFAHALDSVRHKWVHAVRPRVPVKPLRYESIICLDTMKDSWHDRKLKVGILAHSSVFLVSLIM